MGGGSSKDSDKEEATVQEDNKEVDLSQEDQNEEGKKTGCEDRNEEDIAWRKEVFYELYANGKFEFDDHQTIKVSKAIIAAKSKKFHEMFKNSPASTIKIQDYDVPTFKLFLDCLLGFQDCSITDVFLIFPIAFRYETKSFVKDCINILKPTALNEDVCSALNLGMICQCDELVIVVLNFLMGKKLFYKLLDEEPLYKILEPESMLILLRNVTIDSRLLKNILKWGKNYIDKNNQCGNDLKSFLRNQGIMDKLTLSCFETSDSILKFCRSKIGENFFPAEEFFAHVNQFGYKPGKSKWFKIKQGDKITEKVIVKDVFNVEKHEVEVFIFPNSLVFYDHPKKDTDMMICATVIYSYDGIKRKTNNEYTFGATMQMIYSDSIRKGFGVKIEDLTNDVKDVELEIVFNFLFDCRILKMTPKNFLPKDGKKKDELFFVNSVEVVRKKK